MSTVVKNILLSHFQISPTNLAQYQNSLGINNGHLISTWSFLWHLRTYTVGNWTSFSWQPEETPRHQDGGDGTKAQ